MTLRHLSIFSEVCRQESITKAAETLNMAQPAVSTAIRELESYYEVRLFERMNRKIYITHAGQCLLQYADTILNKFHEAKDILKDIESNTQIRIGSNTTFATSHLPKLLQCFSSMHPEIPVYTMVQNSLYIEDSLLRNQLDCAIVDRLSSSDSFISTLLLSEDMVAVYSPSCPYTATIFPHRFAKDTSNSKLALSALKDLPFLLRESGSGSRDCVDTAFQSAGFTPLIAMESVSTMALIEACICGAGILILPKPLATRCLNNHTLYELQINDVDFIRNYYLVYHNSKYLTSGMKLFLNHIKQQNLSRLA